MATEKQAAYFASIFDRESERTRSLRDIAKIYIGLTSIYSAFLVFVSEKMRPQNLLEISIFILCIVCFIASFLFALWVLQVASYQRPSNPYTIIDGFGDAPPEDQNFFDARIVDFTVAASRNALVNDKKAQYLAVSGYLILAGLVVHATYFVVWAIEKAKIL